jgi:sec-independent protein translocase protein TatA
MPFKLGPLELVLILVIVFIIFGAGKLPQIFGSVGKAMRNFRESQNGTDEKEEEVEEVKPRRTTARKTTKKTTTKST